MAVSHVFSNAVGNWTGTATVFNSQGSTTTVAATALVRPQDWNSVHNQFSTLSGNTQGNSTASGTNVVLQGIGAVTLVGSTATIGISVAPQVTYSQWDPYNEGVGVTQTLGNGSFFITPLQFPHVQHDRVGIRFWHSNASNSTGSATYSFAVGVYTRNASTLSLLASTSASRAITFSGTVGNESIQAGPRLVTIPWTQTRSQGDYWVGIGMSFSTGGTSNTLMSFIHNSELASGFSGIFGAANNSTDQKMLGLGRYTAVTAVAPNSIAFSQIQGGGSASVLRPIQFMFQSQTA